jgi:copper transporter 1
MLWNWYTVDACFLSTSWQITSPGMFAGTCIGVIGLVMVLEFLRRMAKEYDRRLLGESRAAVPYAIASIAGAHQAETAPSPDGSSTKLLAGATGVQRKTQFRLSVGQQAIRAALHMLQFAVAYFVMLLAMYYNGYIIISIFIGAFIGHFVFGWETVPRG